METSRDKKIYEFCRGNYYCAGDEDDGGDYLWEPFENYPEEVIEEYIQNDVTALKRFLESLNKEKKEWDEEGN